MYNAPVLEVRKSGHVVAVARHGGFARATAALHITQSALTKSVQSVEHHLGIVLLERGPRGVRLTLEGEWFIERAARVLQEVEEIETGANARAHHVDNRRRESIRRLDVRGGGLSYGFVSFCLLDHR
jgi:DNA-binding transcriptional LysR family regulator